MLNATNRALSPGARVRMHGKLHYVGVPNERGIPFTCDATGQTLVIPINGVIKLMRDCALTTDAEYRALSDEVLDNLERDLGSFPDGDILIASARYAYVRAVAAEPKKFWNDRKAVQAIIERVSVEADNVRCIEKPTYRQLNKWRRRWQASGRDLRALVSSKGGNSTVRYEPWIIEEINVAIDRLHATPLKISIRQTVELARSLIRLRAAKEGRELPSFSKSIVGRGIVETCIAARGQYALLIAQEGKLEADRLMRMGTAGPDGDYPLGRVEVDHTPLDLMIIDPGTGVVLGRPLVTTLIDARTRMSLGFYLGFEAAGWIPVQNALVHAIMPKDRELAMLAEHFGIPFEFDWPCWGSPDLLAVDQAQEFLGPSLAATEAALGMRVIQMPRKSGDKKGKVESNFNKINKELIHLIPGTTKSNVRDRKSIKSEEDAQFSLDEVRFGLTKYFVDIHNRRIHSATGKIPAEMWKAEIAGNYKPAPPEGTVRTLTGKLLVRKLLQGGVRYNNLRWNSRAFQALRNKIGLSTDVTVRLDPLNLRNAHILDPDTHEWVPGDLIAESTVELLTLSQYDYLRKRIDDARVVDEDYELKLARAHVDLLNFFEDRKGTKKVVPREIASFLTISTRAADHIHKERFDPDASAGPIGSHDFTQPIKSGPPDPVGPYRQTVIKPPNPYPQKNADGTYDDEWRPPSLPDDKTPQPPSQPTPAVRSPFSGRRRKD